MAYPSQSYSSARIPGRLDLLFYVRRSVIASQRKVNVNRFKPELVPVQDFNFLGAHFNIGRHSQSISRLSDFVQTSNDKIVSEYDQEIPQLQTADNPTAP